MVDAAAEMHSVRHTVRRVSSRRRYLSMHGVLEPSNKVEQSPALQPVPLWPVLEHVGSGLLAVQPLLQRVLGQLP